MQSSISGKLVQILIIKMMMSNKKRPSFISFDLSIDVILGLTYGLLTIVNVDATT